MSVPVTYCNAPTCGRPLNAYNADDGAWCPHGVGFCDAHLAEDACDECREVAT